MASHERLRTPDRIRVGIAELAVAGDGSVITTSGLGSCVGVALADPERGVAGLVHAMLPSAGGSADGPAAKFVDSGVERLRTALLAEDAAAGGLEARVAGGADMLDFDDGGATVGQRNVAAAREALAEHGVPIVGEHVGGTAGRSLALHTDTGRLVVSSRDERIEL